MAAFGAFWIVVTIGGLILLVAWIILPFAMLGTKPLLRELIREQRRTNELLEAQQRAAECVRSAPAALAAGPAATPPPAPRDRPAEGGTTPWSALPP